MAMKTGVTPPRWGEVIHITLKERCGGEEGAVDETKYPQASCGLKKQQALESVRTWKHQMDSPGLRQFSRHTRWAADKSNEDGMGG